MLLLVLKRFIYSQRNEWICILILWELRLVFSLLLLVCLVSLLRIYILLYHLVIQAFIVLIVYTNRIRVVFWCCTSIVVVDNKWFLVLLIFSQNRMFFHYIYAFLLSNRVYLLRHCFFLIISIYLIHHVVVLLAQTLMLV